jgi:hypothetical protein
LCDSSNSDSVNSFGVCTTDISQCPITGLEFKPIKVEPKPLCPTGKTYNSDTLGCDDIDNINVVQFDNELNLVFSKQNTNLPLTDFKIDMNTPCLEFPNALTSLDEEA